jgi:predicted lipoprotein with Yx(FWY)xxD motif
MRLTVLVLLLVTGCASPDSGPTAGPSASPTSPSPTEQNPTTAAPTGDKPTEKKKRAGTEIIVADSEYGAMLFDRTGQPIYLFTAETSARPACYGDCAQDWPPVLTTGAPRGAGAVRDGLLGTTRRTDGGRQVTYNGHPLYFYAHEGKYQVLCHDVVEYGGTWLVVRPDGTAAPS